MLRIRLAQFKSLIIFGIANLHISYVFIINPFFNRMKHFCFFLVVLYSNVFYSQENRSDSIRSKKSSIIDSNYQKNNISIQGATWYPFLYNFSENFKYYKNGTLENGKGSFIFGFRGTYIRYVSKQFGIGVEYSYDRTKIQLPTFFLNPPGMFILREHEALPVNTNQMSIVLNWRKFSKNEKIRFSHQLGIGFLISKISNKNHYIVDDVELHDGSDSAYTVAYYTNLKEGIDNHSIFKTNTFFGNTISYAFGLDFKIKRAVYLTFSIRKEFGLYFNSRYETTDTEYKTEVWSGQGGLSINLRNVGGLTAGFGMKFEF